MDYQIKIEVTSKRENGLEIVGSGTAESIEIAEQVLGRAEKWIKQYEEEYCEECTQCGNKIHRDDISIPEDKELEDLVICQDCLEEIMSGDKKVKI